MARLLFITLLLLAGCNFLSTDERPTSVNVMIPSNTPPALVDAPTPQATNTPYPVGLQDVLPILSGICFEAAWDAAEQVFIMRNAEEHIRFYDLADNSRLCRLPVTRHPFDFSRGDVLAGLWSRGMGCVARYDILNYTRDDAAKMVRIDIDFVTEGDCPYELVRGFWVSISNAPDYAIAIQLVE
jgi:hypothetical protein